MQLLAIAAEETEDKSQYRQQQQKEQSTQEQTKEETPSSITTAAYNQLDSNEQKLYEPVGNKRGRTVAYVPIEDGDYEEVST